MKLIVNRSFQSIFSFLFFADQGFHAEPGPLRRKASGRQAVKTPHFTYRDPCCNQRSEAELCRAFSLTHQPICRLGVCGLAVQTLPGSGGQFLYHVAALDWASRGQVGEQDRAAVSGAWLLQGGRSAAGRTQMVTVQPQVTARPRWARQGSCALAQP